MRAEFIQRLQALNYSTARKDIKDLENDLMTEDGVNEAALDLSIRSLEARKTDFSKFTVATLIRSYRDKLIASKGASCGLCDSSGWLHVIVLDYREERWLVNYADTKRAFKYCSKVPTAASDVVCVPCVCSNGDRHNQKHEKEWLTVKARRMAADYTPRGKDRVEANAILRTISDALNARNEDFEAVQ